MVEKNILINSINFGDCLELMKLIPDNSIDMICCDLPYGKTRNKKDVVLPLDLLWVQYKRIIKNKGIIVLFGQGTFYCDLINSNRKWFRYDLVWNKVLPTGFLNAKSMPLRTHEQIAIFYKQAKGTYNPQFTVGKPLHGKGNSYKTKIHKNENYGEFKQLDDTRKGSTEKYPVSVLNFPKPHPSKAKHRTEKPVDCLEWLIKTYSNEGDVILDNCAGSGGVGEVCIKTNRKFILMENDEININIIKQRLNGKL